MKEIHETKLVEHDFRKIQDELYQTKKEILQKNEDISMLNNKLENS